MLFEHNVRQKWLPFYDKMDPPTSMTINVKQRHTISLKFGDTILTSLIKLLPKVKYSICSVTK